MIYDVDVDDWDELIQHFTVFSSDEDEQYLYRGHGDSNWTLQTTLERHGHPSVRFEDYYRLIASTVKSQVETITGTTFDVPDFAEVKDLLRNYDDFSMLPAGLPAYAFMLHLRHCGFPSPILDWTRSPYVATFFAFTNPESAAVPKRSIYAWQRNKIRPTGTNSAELRRLGPNVSTHRRHALQQADYSLCATFLTPKNEWRLTAHEDGFAKTGHGAQDVYKFNIPSTERKKVLKFLDEFNLNAYSLFGSEESLMNMLAVRAFDLKPFPKRGR